MNPTTFLSAVQTLNFEDTFNPYVDRCRVHDAEDAPQRRSGMLLDLLERAVAVELDAIWIGRDLGYRGGRRTGLALTDDVHLEHHLARWEIKTVRPTRGRPVAERTAAVVWNLLGQVRQPIFLWNVFPLHPFPSGDEFSNRAHNAKERKAGEDLLRDLIAMLRPARLIAIGNDAHSVTSRLCSNERVIKVRHPSYGGQTEFTSSITNLYDIDITPSQPRLL